MTNNYWKLNNIALTGSALTIAAALALLTNYSIRQKLSEYRTLHASNAIYAEQGRPPQDLAEFLAMTRKESNFKVNSVGADDEIGLTQLKRDVAEYYGLETHPEGIRLKRTGRLQKLLSIESSPYEEALDDRFIRERNLHGGISYFFDITDRFEKKYGMDHETAMDFSTIAFNMGMGNVDKLLSRGYSHDIEDFIERLSSEDLDSLNISDRKRLVVVNHHRMVRQFENNYDATLDDMLQRHSPMPLEFYENLKSNFVEIIDIPKRETHILFGALGFIWLFSAYYALKRRNPANLALITVGAAELANEALDLFDALSAGKDSSLSNSAEDLLYSMAIQTVLYAISYVARKVKKKK